MCRTIGFNSLKEKDRELNEIAYNHKLIELTEKCKEEIWNSVFVSRQIGQLTLSEIKERSQKMALELLGA